METTGVRQGMIMMHLGVMDTVFHSGDEWFRVLKYPESFVKNELNIVQC